MITSDITRELYMAAHLINDIKTKTDYAFSKIAEDFGKEINNLHMYISIIQ